MALEPFQSIPKTCQIVIQCLFSVYFDIFTGCADQDELLNICYLCLLKNGLGVLPAAERSEDSKLDLCPHFQAQGLSDTDSTWPPDGSQQYLSETITLYLCEYNCLELLITCPQLICVKMRGCLKILSFVLLIQHILVEWYLSIQNNLVCLMHFVLFSSIYTHLPFRFYIHRYFFVLSISYQKTII